MNGALAMDAPPSGPRRPSATAPTTAGRPDAAAVPPSNSSLSRAAAIAGSGKPDATTFVWESFFEGCRSAMTAPGRGTAPRCLPSPTGSWRCSRENR